MASAMRVFRKLRASDGRIKIATLSGVSVLVAVIAMLVGVLPVMADHVEGEPNSGHPLVGGVTVDWGGGSGACKDQLISLEGSDKGTARGPSAASYELHINNPTDGFFTDPIGGGRVKLTVGENDQLLEFQFVDQNDEPVSVGEPGTMVAHDVVINGGSKSTHYDYDAVGDPVTTDKQLHAPPKGGKGDYFNLSHVNICYDVAPVNFVCGTSEKLEGEGLITNVSAVIFENSVPGTFDCSGSKDASYFIDNDTVTLDFGDDGEANVAGRLDFTKDFGDPSLFEDLEYDGPGEFVDLQWCEIRDVAEDDLVVLEGAGNPVNPFATWLPDGKYPSLLAVNDTLDGGTPNDTSDDTTVQATACKVAEIENAAGEQVSVVYFEFKDPQFR